MSGNINLDFSLLKKLTQAYGPSGNEKEIAGLIMGYSKNHVDNVETDILGNLIIRKKGRGKRIMIAAHMDEVGVIVTHIDNNGYLYFSAVGGLNEAGLLARRVMFSNRCYGVIGRERKESEEEKSKGKYFIDIGVNSEEEARKMVREGDMAILTGEFVENGSHIISKAIDNRLGCFIALEVLKNYQGEDDVFFVFTVQEEVGARGAKTAVFAIEPDLALIIDTTISYDTPKEKYRTSLNNGVAIKVMDRSIIVSPVIKNWMIDIAVKNNIVFQSEIISAGGTDSGPVHLTKGGVPTGGIAVPVRYLHSGSEITTKLDIESAYRLLSELLKNPFAS